MSSFWLGLNSFKNACPVLAYNFGFRYFDGQVGRTSRLPILLALESWRPDVEHLITEFCTLTITVVRSSSKSSQVKIDQFRSFWNLLFTYGTGSVWGWPDAFCRSTSGDARSKGSISRIDSFSNLKNGWTCNIFWILFDKNMEIYNVLKKVNKPKF